MRWSMWSSALNRVTPVWRRRWPRWTALVIIGLLALVSYWEIRLAGGAVSAQGNAYLGPGLAVALVAILGAWLELSPGAVINGGALRKRWILGLEVALII